MFSRIATWPKAYSFLLVDTELSLIPESPLTMRHRDDPKFQERPDSRADYSL
jgi:hypothetical protein